MPSCTSWSPILSRHLLCLLILFRCFLYDAVSYFHYLHFPRQKKGDTKRKGRGGMGISGCGMGVDWEACTTQAGELSEVGGPGEDPCIFSIHLIEQEVHAKYGAAGTF